jgi:hypothetical protein
VHPERVNLQLRYDSRFQVEKKEISHNGLYMSPEGKLTHTGVRRIMEKIHQQEAVHATGNRS